MKKILMMFAVLLSGCVYGPQVEHKSPLNTLNSENYETPPDGGANAVLAPMLKRKDRLTRIRGRVMTGQEGFETPVKFVSVVLTSEGQRITATTDLDGKFILAGTLKNGTYHLAVDSGRWTGEADVVIDSYSIENIFLFVRPMK